MKKIDGKRFMLVLPTELADRVGKQSKKEGRTLADFIRRVLDRYILEQEFRGTSDADQAAQASINENRKLLDLLKDS